MQASVRLKAMVANSLNATGEQGWELVSYERLSNLFPKDAEGTLLIRPAATGPGREHTSANSRLLSGNHDHEDGANAAREHADFCSSARRRP